MTIEEAKNVLREAGYYVDNLWNIEDVRINANWDEDEEEPIVLTDDECYDILDSVLTDEYFMQQINEAIDDEIRDYVD